MGMKYKYILKLQWLFPILFFSMPLYSCESLLDDLEDDYYAEDTGLTIHKYSKAKYSCQSMACYGDYAFIVSDKLHTIGMYNLKTKRNVYTEVLPTHLEQTPGGNTQYHCNQSSFSPYMYDANDDFPVMYVSQRNDETLRCKIVGLRIITEKDSDGNINSFHTEEVQIIYLPAMTKANALGNANLVFDYDRRQMITYSRNNKKSDSNYLTCRITTFDIPDSRQDTIYLEDSDIRDSYEIDCSAMNMQGGAIYDNKLYIGQGSKSSGYINLRVVDLQNRRLQITYDLLAMGVEWEPEGCIVYDNKLIIHASYRLWEFPNIFELSSRTSRAYMSIGDYHPDDMGDN